MFNRDHIQILGWPVLLTILVMSIATVGLAQETSYKDQKGKKEKRSTEEVEAPTHFPDSTKTIANPELKPNWLRKIMIGKNYRREWTDSVQVSVIDFAKRGLTPKKEGGGKQTHSLKAEDASGNGWSLRSVRKYPEKAIPEELQHTIAEKIVGDAISESYPYGALSMPVLSTAAGVPYLKSTLAFIPDDPHLGRFRAKYKNTIVLMEEKEPEIPNLPILDSAENLKTVGTEKVVMELQKSNKYKINEPELLKVRLLDNFVMDFDRHEGQWEWMKADSANDKIFYAVPKDRDQVFFVNQGLIPGMGKGAIPEIQGFRVRPKNVVTFNNTARNFDRYFLTGLNEKDWQTTIDGFLNAMTDSVITTALYQQPREIQKYSVDKIIRTLQEKRKYFKSDMLKYYRALSQTVSIVGSNESEAFNITKDPEGRVIVTIHKLEEDGKSTAIYERVFDPAVTREIRIYGLEGNDKFTVQGGKSPIKIRLIGGPGKDEFINEGTGGKLWVYDVKADDNTVSGSGIKNRINSDPMNNEFNRLGFQYNRAGIGPYFEYAFDGGLYFGLQYKITKHGFRKEPFAVNHQFIAGRTLYINSYLFRYNGIFTKAIGRTDLLVQGEYFLPTARTNFFGLGNETVYDKSGTRGEAYYRARYQYGNFSLLARTPFGPSLSISYGPSFQYFRMKDKQNAGKYISNTDLPGVNPKLLQQENYYGGGEIRFNVDTRNDKIIPTRGIYMNTNARSLIRLNTPSSNLTQLGTDLSFYTDFLSRNKLVLAMGFGVSHNFGDYQFPQAQSLGFTEHLRGFRIERFAGRSRAYNNLELRWKVGDLNAYLFRGNFGLLAFHDMGRVWIEGERSSVWHNGYGGGIWLSPFGKFVVTGMLSYSKEESNLALITIGYQF